MEMKSLNEKESKIRLIVERSEDTNKDLSLLVDEFFVFPTPNMPVSPIFKEQKFFTIDAAYKLLDKGKKRKTNKRKIISFYKDINLLSNNIKINNKSFCSNCLDKNILNDMQQKVGADFWYMFDTDICDKCKSKEEVLYMPLWTTIFEKDTTKIISWFKNNMPRTKNGILEMLKLNTINLKRIARWKY